MSFQLKSNWDEYYVVKQIVEGYKTRQFKIYRTNEESIIKFTRLMAGTVAVYIYNDKTNQRIDLTENLGRKQRPLDEFREHYEVNLKFYAGKEDYNNRSRFFDKVIMYKDVIKDIGGLKNNEKKPMYFVEKWGKTKDKELVYYALKELTYHSVWTNPEYIKQQNKKFKTFGDEYEKFIGKKYENIGKNVIYHGLNLGKKDNGIDLIIDEKKSITFVQCKNWKSMGHHKLNQKDIRAFIGDCYMYMFNNQINKKHNFHFIVADSGLLTKSAEIYIQNNCKLKFKIIPFERKKLF